MPRRARLVVPDVPHHITQRGYRRRDIFFTEDDRRHYIALLTNACLSNSVRCRAWCLMSNHVHMVLVPATTDGLRATLSSVNIAYTRHFTTTHDLTGRIHQSRFASVPMGDAHWVAAVRYIELNPVRAGLCGRAEDWPWSSARAHIAGRSSGLTDVEALDLHVKNWRVFLADDAEAANRP